MLTQFDYWWVQAYQQFKTEFWTAGCGDIGNYFRCLIQDETVGQKMMKGVLAVIASDPWLAMEYADDFIQNPWPPGEDAIATDAWASYSYATRVLNGRFRKGEAAIARDEEYALEYALDVVEGRFKEGEKAISKDPERSYLYLTKVIPNARCSFMAKAILPDAALTYRYLEHLMKRGRRWSIGMKRLAQDAEYSYKVAAYLFKGRWTMGEPAIATNPKYASAYAVDVLKDIFPEGEAAIIKDADAIRNYMRNVKSYWREGLTVLGIDPDDEEWYECL